MSVSSHQEIDLYESKDWRIAGVVSTDCWRVNCWIVKHQRSPNAAVIDLGATFEQVKQALVAIDGIASHLLLTHGHHDHVTNAQMISEALSLSVQVHPEDRRLVAQSAMWSARLSGRVIRTPRRIEELPVDHVNLDGQQLKVRHSPGHTPGGVVFVADGFVFTGDTLFRGMIGRTDLPGGNLAAIRESVDDLVTAYPDTWLLLPGHGPCWTVGEARAWWSEVRNSGPPCLDSLAP